MKTILFLLAFCFTSSTFSYDNILVIGDSHTAGWFGQDLHHLLAKSFNNVATYGHSSSAPTHWMSSSESRLSGGKFHKIFSHDTHLKDPFPTHWRKRVIVPKFQDLTLDMSLHSAWKNSLNKYIVPDLVVIGLGANDARAISNSAGKIDKYQFEKRSTKINEMLDAVDAIGAKCIWITPPNGIKKTEANQSSLYKYLYSGIGERCSIYNSNHHKVTGCDGVHFNCKSHRLKASKWAKEVYNYILKNRNQK